MMRLGGKIMTKEDLVLAELNKQNYYLEAIAQATQINPLRVESIIGRLVLKGKIDGEVNQEQKMYVPGYTSSEYLRAIRLILVSRILAPIAFAMAFVLPIVFVSFIATGGGFLIEQWRINMSYTIAGIVLFISTLSLILSVMVRHTRIGKVNMGITIVALVGTLIMTLMIVLFSTVFQNFFGNFT